MRLIVLFSLFVFALACNGAPAESKKTLPVNKGEVKAVDAKTDPANEEDCDEKAKKPIEIKAETISLSGNTGCSLDEAQDK